VITIVKVISAGGFLLCVAGLIAVNVDATVTGLVMTIIGKSWFLDRMVWLYEEMRSQHPEYDAWSY